ncbi:MAG: hypothetical protein IPM04_00050 [Saprospiraceae bacterium]|nr:hypothetical protein [Candidatus Brachybacter algidus]
MKRKAEQGFLKVLRLNLKSTMGWFFGFKLHLTR